MKSLYLHFRSLILIAAMMCSTGASAQFKDGSFSGVIHPVSHLSPLDSALVFRNSDLYSGKKETGEISSILYKWVNEDHEKYFPVMQEAWKLCLEKCPYQLNLYLDGIDMYRYMIAWAKERNDSVRYEQYYDELMNLWDTRSDYTDSINANMHRKDHQSSSYTIRMNKVNDYYTYHVAGRGFSNDSVAVTMYEQYRPIIDDLGEAIDKGEHVGGDIDAAQLKMFMGNSVNVYAQDVNRMLAKGTNKQKQEKEAARINALIEEHAKIRDACKVKREEAREAFNKNKTPENRAIYDQLNAEFQTAQQEHKAYADSLKAEFMIFQQDLNDADREMIDDRKQEVIKQYQILQRIVMNHEEEMEDPAKIAPFKAMMDDVQLWMAQTLNYDDYVDVSELHEKYSKDFEEKKGDYAWLTEAVTKYQNASGFKRDDPFYKELCDARTAARPRTPEKTENASSAAMDENRALLSQYINKANSYYSRIYNKNGNLNSRAFEFAIVGYDYFNRALRIAPSNKQIKNCRENCKKVIKAEMFMAGKKPGQKVTVDGETFTVPN